MRTKIVYFLGGLIVCFASMVTFWEYRSISYTEYQFDDPEKSARLMIFLDANDILYSYQVDHLKRHWVIPHIEIEKLRIEIISEFEASEINRVNIN